MALRQSGAVVALEVSTFLSSRRRPQNRFAARLCAHSADESVVLLVMWLELDVYYDQNTQTTHALHNQNQDRVLHLLELKRRVHVAAVHLGAVLGVLCIDSALCVST